jgi:hypothetical protein
MSLLLTGAGRHQVPAPIGGFALDYKSSAVSNNAGPTVNYGTLTFDSGKYVVLATVWLENNPAGQPTAATVDGVSLTHLYYATRGTFGPAIDFWISPTTMTNSSGAASVTYAQATGVFGVSQSIALYSLSTTTPTPSDMDQFVVNGGGSSMSVSGLTVPSGGAAIVVASNDGFSAFRP